MSRTPPRDWFRFWLLASNLTLPMLVFGSGFAFWWLNMATATVHALLIYALVAPGCGWLGPVITRFKADGKEVWLTIDDGPVDATAELAKALHQRHVPVTFFVKGRSVLLRKEAVAELQHLGHSVANHTHTHPALMFWWLLPGVLRREIDDANQALMACGVQVLRWFRAPVGLKHVLLHRQLAASGMRLVAWNVRGLDGLGADPATVIERVRSAAQPGSIIVLHEGHPRSVECILGCVDALLADGYRFVIPQDEQLV